GALDLDPGVGSVRRVEDRDAPPALDRVQARDPGGQLNHDEPDGLAHETVAEGEEAREARVGALAGGGRQDGPEVPGDADVGEERVESLAGEDLDPVAHGQDFSHGCVGRGDDRAGGGAAGGVRAGQLRHLHVLCAGGGVGGEGKAPGNVLDEI